tara:strand:+ start:35 stop:2182 length:2148 start_codon:yes stop_codon:yes gene_type:complete
MAQTIKLKRTAVQGKIPTTSNIELGELAMNTYDGRIFFEKNNGTPSVQEIITTDSEVTGSLNLNGAVTASSLNITGNTTIGGDLTLEGQLTIGDATTDSVNVIASLSSSLIPESTLNFDLGSSSRKWGNSYIGTSNVDIQNIIDSRSGQNYTLTVGANSTGDKFHVATNNSANEGIVLSSRNTGNTTDQKLSFSGSAFEFGGGDVNILGNLTLGGNITIGNATTDSISVSADFSSSLIPDSGSTYDLGSSSKTWNEVHADTLYGDGSNITNITVDSAATVSSTYTNSSSITVSHNFNTRNILVAVYDNQNNQILPQNVNTSNLDQVVITLSSAQSGTVVVAKGGHILSGSANNSNQLNGQNASYYLDYDNFTDIPSGIVSGSSQTIEHLPTGVVSGSQAAARAQLGLDTGNSPTFTDLTLSGDLVVQGTTTTLNTTTFNVEDNIIELNYGGTATEGGIFVKDSTGGSTTSGSLLWDATNDYWKAGKAGSESKILLANGDSIVSASAQTVSHLGGTGIISGSSQLDGTSIGATSDIIASGSFSGSFVGDGSGLTGIQVDQIASVTASFSNQSTINVSHNFDTRNVLVSTYDSSYNQLIPETVSLTNSNTVQVVLSGAHSGHVVVAKGGHVVSGSTEATNITGLGDEIQTLTSYRQDVTGAAFYTITHGLNERYPFVQAWNTTNNTQEVPLDIESVHQNQITVSFSSNFAGKIIVKK